MIYEYKCKECELEFTEMRQMKEREEPIDCPSCNGAGKPIISTPMFRTSGTGHGRGAGHKGEWK